MNRTQDELSEEESARSEDGFPYISDDPCPECGGRLLIGMDCSNCLDCGRQTGVAFAEGLDDHTLVVQQKMKWS